MMVFNKLAVEKLPLECCLVCLQPLSYSYIGPKKR